MNMWAGSIPTGHTYIGGCAGHFEQIFVSSQWAQRYHALIPAIAILDGVQVWPQMHLEQIFVGYHVWRRWAGASLCWHMCTIIVIWKSAVVGMQSFSQLRYTMLGWVYRKGKSVVVAITILVQVANALGTKLPTSLGIHCTKMRAVGSSLCIHFYMYSVL